MRKIGNHLEKSAQFWNCPKNEKWSKKFGMVLKPSGKWEMIWKNLDSFETVRKMGNDSEISGWFWNRPENGKWFGKIWTVLKMSRMSRNDPEISRWFWKLLGNGKWSGKIWTVLKQSWKRERIWKNQDDFETIRKWEMIWKNPDSFDTIRKMGNDPQKSGQFWNRPEMENDLEKSGQFVRFFCYTCKKILDEPKNFRVAMLPATQVVWFWFLFSGSRFCQLVFICTWGGTDNKTARKYLWNVNSFKYTT